MKCCHSATIHAFLLSLLFDCKAVLLKKVLSSNDMPAFNFISFVKGMNKIN